MWWLCEIHFIATAASIVMSLAAIIIVVYRFLKRTRH